MYLDTAALPLIQMILAKEEIDEQRWYLIRVMAEAALNEVRANAARILAASDPEFESRVLTNELPAGIGELTDRH